MKHKRAIAAFGLMITALVILCMADLMLGTVSVPVKELMDILGGRITEGMNHSIIMGIRLPRMLGAVITGGALALSGYLLQTFFANPVVGPFVLGISSGAKLAVALSMIFILSRGLQTGSAMLITAAFAGAMTVMGFVLLVSLKVKSRSALVVCGIMAGYICSAVTDLVVTFADDANIVNLHNWSLGSLSGLDMPDVTTMAVIVLLCSVLIFFMSKPIGAYRLGENYAANMGVNVTALRVILILVSSMLAACVTAFVGPVSFVGIAIPHLTKSAFKTTSPRVMIPACFLLGACVTVLCDGIARTVFAPTEVSISSVTAVLLVPVVIRMLISRKARS
ncbi:MAG: iron ABC transporter permease [Lachnospiraceae bacterium]|nr:iron ABC transporter permease [Lachnospiraceae bacterium]